MQAPCSGGPVPASRGEPDPEPSLRSALSKGCQGRRRRMAAPTPKHPPGPALQTHAALTSTPKGSPKGKGKEGGTAGRLCRPSSSDRVRAMEPHTGNAVPSFRATCWALPARFPSAPRRPTAPGRPPRHAPARPPTHAGCPCPHPHPHVILLSRRPTVSGFARRPGQPGGQSADPCPWVLLWGTRGVHTRVLMFAT